VERIGEEAIGGRRPRPIVIDAAIPKRSESANLESKGLRSQTER
jgi:hypothetical protein